MDEIGAAIILEDGGGQLAHRVELRNVRRVPPRLETLVTTLLYRGIQTRLVHIGEHDSHSFPSQRPTSGQTDTATPTRDYRHLPSQIYHLKPFEQIRGHSVLPAQRVSL